MVEGGAPEKTLAPIETSDALVLRIKRFIHRRLVPGRLLKKAVCRLVKKILEPTRAKNRRVEAYLGATLERLRLERE